MAGKPCHCPQGLANVGRILCYVRSMATIQEAVQNAMNFARETLGPGRTEGLQLEEVESASVGGEDAWLITLSMLIPRTILDRPVLNAFSAKREYKVFTVLKKNGEVTSMRIRELAAT